MENNIKTIDNTPGAPLDTKKFAEEAIANNPESAGIAKPIIKEDQEKKTSKIAELTEKIKGMFGAGKEDYIKAGEERLEIVTEEVKQAIEGAIAAHPEVKREDVLAVYGKYGAIAWDEKKKAFVDGNTYGGFNG